VDRVDAWLRAHLAPNTRNTYISKLTQVMKRAFREGLVHDDAGRNVKLRLAETKSRALTAGQLRILMDAEPETEIGREALDFFRLSFYLRAINPVDLMRVTPDDIFNGRLMYERAKTGKAYSVRIEPEAQEIMDRRSDAWRIWSPGRGRELRNYQQDLNDALRRIAKGLGLPPVTMYWARHTFASLMLETGAPIETIAAALGHSYGPKVTMGYVTIRERAVDDAVRALLDYVVM
jgi:Site-specific recombinase XerD